MSQYILLDNVVVPGVIKRTIDESLECAEETIKRVEERLKMLAVCSPHDVKEDNGDHLNWVNYIARETRIALEELQEAYVNRHLLLVAKSSDENDVKESY
jgi:hypothetical protein